MGEEPTRVVVCALVRTGGAVLLVGEGESAREVPQVTLAAGEGFLDAARRALRTAGIETAAEGRLAWVRNEIDEGRPTISLLVSYLDAEASSSPSLVCPLDALPPLSPRAEIAIASLDQDFAALDVDDELLPLHAAPRPKTAAKSIAPPAVVPPAKVIEARPLGRRFVDLLGAGALLGGAYLWLLGLFALMKRRDLWSSDHSSFALSASLATLVATFVAVRFGFPIAATSAKQRVLRGMGSIVLAMVVCFFVIFLVEALHIRSGDEEEWFIYFGAAIVLLLRWLAGRARVKEPLPRLAITFAWATVLFVTLWTVSPKLRRAVSHRETTQDVGY
jgi:ADP-ribose pyrophosphatase YjhB (NUDIX family)